MRAQNTAGKRHRDVRPIVIKEKEIKAPLFRGHCPPYTSSNTVWLKVHGHALLSPRIENYWGPWAYSKDIELLIALGSSGTWVGGHVLATRLRGYHPVSRIPQGGGALRLSSKRSSRKRGRGARSRRTGERHKGGKTTQRTLGHANG